LRKDAEGVQQVPRRALREKGNLFAEPALSRHGRGVLVFILSLVGKNWVRNETKAPKSGEKKGKGKYSFEGIILDQSSRVEGVILAGTRH